MLFAAASVVPWNNHASCVSASSAGKPIIAWSVAGRDFVPTAIPAYAPMSLPKLKGSIGEGSNHSNFSHQSSVRILGIQRKPRKAPARKKPLRRSGIRPKIQEGAARKERKGKQTALRERGVRRPRIGAKDAIHAVKRCYACLQTMIEVPSARSRCE